jgi:5-methyltetrahydropteroyltriglutamate--homocysteine methyltransferase
MRVESIVDAGYLLQVDCPDLAMGRHAQYFALTETKFLDRICLHIEALNNAVGNINPDRMRIHLCWGNYEGPHHLDVELRSIIDVVLKARPQAVSFEAANPRHAHEWMVFENTKLPDDKILIPGVIDTSTNYIEHPDLVAERITRFVNLVGADRVIAGTDCGFSTFASFLPVSPRIAWAKLSSLVEGASRASARA